ncbi:hypothetical protein J4231_02510 [Candidatus Woesearchaeota archaeon]|nr:hypothetical protein [Candidatus Woesearchaeota archaeon]
MGKEIENKWYYFSIITLSIYFIIRVLNESKILHVFPLDYTNDYASHIAKLFFLDKCGLFDLCPYWYNGVDVFSMYPPGWFIFTLPIYYLTNNLLYSTFISEMILFFISLLIINYFGKKLDISFAKRLGFFVLFSFNAMSIGNYVRLGRLPEMFSWVNFLVFAFLMLYFLKKRLDWRFIFISIFYALIVISHQTTAIVSSVLFLSLFLAKRGKEKMIVIASAALALALSSWWWIEYLMNVGDGSALTYVLSNWLLDFKTLLYENIAAIILPLASLALFYFYIRDKSKEERLFFIPIVAIIILVMTRLIVFIPLFNYVYTDPYMYFILFFALYFMTKTRLPRLLYALAVTSLVLVPIASIAVNEVHTPYLPNYGERQKNAVEIVDYIEGRFFIDSYENYETYSELLEDKDALFAKAFYALAATKGKNGAGGWNEQFVSKEYNRLVNSRLVTRDCDKMKNDLNTLNVTEVIVFDEDCIAVKKCGLNEKKRIGDACLYEMDSK